MLTLPDMQEKEHDAIIIGGSYAGLSAAMALGRASRHIMIIDNGKPCNRQTPYAHNFITHDGEKPAIISQKAKEQVLAYPTVEWYNESVIYVRRKDLKFSVETSDGKIFFTKKILFTTGMKDLLPEIPGFKESWGISVIHCPYCHGYEVKNTSTGIIANSAMTFEYTKTIHHWTKDLTLFTNGKSVLDEIQTQKLKDRNIQIVETEIDSIEHENGQIVKLILKDESEYALNAIYSHVPTTQPFDVPEKLGCVMTEQGHIWVDDFKKTNISGVFAAGDNTTMMRSLSTAIAAGNMAGVMINKELIEEEF